MNKQIQDAYIVCALRTPVGKAPRGMFRRTRPDDLLAHVLRGLREAHPRIDPEAIADVIVGCAMPEAEQGMNVARIALLLAGYPAAVPGVTVNRFCASGLQAVAMAADRIRLGEADLVIAAGVESMSMIPIMGNKVSFNPRVLDDNEQLGIAYGMGVTAEKVAQRWGVAREAQDAFALRSHRRALAAIAGGEFADEILPYEISTRAPDLDAGELRLDARTADTDEGPRPDTSAEALARLRPVFAARGTVTAGNSSQMSDGAGAVLLANGP
jgi:acetyl-CoA acyltransferase